MDETAEQFLIGIVLIIIIVSAVYISLIQAIDYYYNSYGSSLSGRCGRDNIEVETARYQRYHHISQDGTIFMRAVMVIFCIYLFYMYLNYYLSGAVSALWFETKDRYNYWMEWEVITNWTTFLFFVSTLLIASVSTIAVNVDRGGSDEYDSLSTLFVIPIVLLLMSVRFSRSADLDTTSSKTNYTQDAKLLIMTMYITTVITAVIQADKKEPILPILLGAATLAGAFWFIVFKQDPDPNFYQPFIYGIILSVLILMIWVYHKIPSNKSKSNEYKEKIIELNMKFQSILEKDKASIYKVDKDVEGMSVIKDEKDNVLFNFMDFKNNKQFQDDNVAIKHIVNNFFGRDEGGVSPIYTFYKKVFSRLLEIDEKDFDKEIKGKGEDQQANRKYIIDWLLNDPIGEENNPENPNEPTIIWLIKNNKIPTEKTVKYFMKYEVDRENNTLLQFVINKYNQFNKEDVDTSFNVLNNSILVILEDGSGSEEKINIQYLGNPVKNVISIDKTNKYEEIAKKFNTIDMEIRKLPVMYIPFFGGGQKGIERMIQHLENSGVKIKDVLTDDDKNDISRLYGELAEFDREPSDLGNVFSGFTFLCLGYFTVSWGMGKIRF